jgi:hypothetical protein
MVTDLRRITHCKFFAGVLATAGGVPAHTSVDGGPWGGVRHMLSTVIADVDAPTFLDIDGEVRAYSLNIILCFIVVSFSLTQRTVVRPFNKTSSKRQTPVERHWRETNRTTRKFKAEFLMIESAGYYDHENPIDKYSLIEVYRAAVWKDLDQQYKAMRFWVKTKCTTSPSVPKRRRSRIQLYLGFPNRITALSAAQIADMEVAAEAYCGPEALSPWQMDSLRHFPHAASARHALILVYRRDSLISLAEEYALHVSFSKSFLDTHDTSVACDAAIDFLIQFSEELSGL